MPDDASLHVKVTVTFELFQPIAFGDGVAVAVMPGGTESLPAMASITIEKPSPAYLEFPQKAD